MEEFKQNWRIALTVKGNVEREFIILNAYLTIHDHTSFFKNRKGRKFFVFNNRSHNYTTLIGNETDMKRAVSEVGKGRMIDGDNY